ncbi:MAG: enterotoxin [Candidatus Omnitrophica bacterium]|nr:enterotoxin [Candidatus Omnitrophota bacterium]
MTSSRKIIVLFLMVVWPGLMAMALEFPGPAPGKAQAEVQDQQVTLGNAVIACTWSVKEGRLRLDAITDRITKSIRPVPGSEVFELITGAAKDIAGSSLRIASGPEVQDLPAIQGASVAARRVPGKRLIARLVSDDGNLEVEWRAVLHDGANAIRQELVFTAQKHPIPVEELRLVDLPLADAAVAGTVPGSPVASGHFFFAIEHPDARSEVIKDGTLVRAICGLAIDTNLPPQVPLSVASVVGVVPEGQLRRGFLYYVERERAHPYHPFLHYNSWYDICWGEIKIGEPDCLKVIDAIGRELIQKRGVPLAAFVWDDGWDDPKTLWQTSADHFPNGFARVLAAARRYHSTLGFWLSPFGGYGKPAQDRLAMGKRQGFELGPRGFSLAGPKYYERFLATCRDMIEKNGANFFKFDGLARDFKETEAMLRLSRALRELKPDLFLSITTGTWPSPFWLWYGDSTWRGGGDMGWCGQGSKREQWITYRDAETFQNVARPAPLYPLNALMNQGFANARHGMASELGSSAEEIRHELRSFFACGTCLQELYMTADMMTAVNWDDLAETAAWSQRNADVLADTHWIGGNPADGQIYGWASWSPRKGVLALRNPSPQYATISIDIGKALELPAGAPSDYRLKSPWKSDASLPVIEVRAGSPHTFQLEPFEVLVYETLAHAK